MKEERTKCVNEHPYREFIEENGKGIWKLNKTQAYCKWDKEQDRICDLAKQKECDCFVKYVSEAEAYKKHHGK